MSATKEKSAQLIIANEYLSTSEQHMLALVQGDIVISTFPEDQTDAAIDLARVLCRALTQPVDLFRVRCCEVDYVGSGASAQTSGPGWTHLAHLHFTFLQGVDVVLYEPGRQEELVNQYQTP